MSLETASSVLNFDTNLITMGSSIRESTMKVRDGSSLCRHGRIWPVWTFCLNLVHTTYR